MYTKAKNAATLSMMGRHPRVHNKWVIWSDFVFPKDHAGWSASQMAISLIEKRDDTGSNQGVRRRSGKIYLDSAYTLNDIKKSVLN